MKESFQSKLGLENSKHVLPGDVSISKSYKRKSFFGGIFELILLVIFALIIIFLGWLTVFGPVRTTTGYIQPSANPPRNGSQVIVTDHQDDFGGRIINGSLKQDVKYGKVVVGNYGTLTPTGKVYTVVQDDHVIRTNAPIVQNHGKYLDNEYIVKCTGGPCKVGSEFIASQKNVRLYNYSK